MPREGIDFLKQIAQEVEELENELVTSRLRHVTKIYAKFRRSDLEAMSATDFADMLRYDQAGVQDVSEKYITIYKTGDLNGGRGFTLRRWSSFGVSIIGESIHPDFAV